MNKGTFLGAVLALAAGYAAAEVPQGYYGSLEGKSGDALATAVADLAGYHLTITYNTKTWPAFEKTDVREIAGRQVWWDMYSNNLVWLPGHDSMNIEHGVANSWWGGKSGSTQAYSDLFHLTPSDQNANNKKDSYPPGEVADARLLDNGLLKIGTPAPGQGGGATSVFEPADEYKGDFARAYFYIFTTYADLSWKENYAYVYDTAGALQPWAVELLLKWHRQDPVSTKEKERNEQIYLLQKNRNPYIDYPDLAEYIWGNKKGVAYTPAATPAVATDRPEAPTFSGSPRMTAVNTYSTTYQGDTEVKINHVGKLNIRLDNGAWIEPTGDIISIPASDSGIVHTLEAYSTDTESGLNSPIARLHLRSTDPDEIDYTNYRWIRMSTQVNTPVVNNPLILVSDNMLHVMSTDGGTTSKTFMESAGFPDVDSDCDMISCIPDRSAIVKFENVGNSKVALRIFDIHNKPVGYWNTSAAKAMRLDAVKYTPAQYTLDSEGNFTLTFDGTGVGSLQFNQTQPRFLNYTTAQKPVRIYLRNDVRPSGIENFPTDEPDDWKIGVSDGNITLPAKAVIIDLQGRQISGDRLQPGIYVVTDGRRSEKIII
ncbi:MAG: endonuclease [Muribaculaceae bacterium]|nr:endonuclease [Muribaculaceae bacterium]